MESPDYEVAIVGAGPGGLAAAVTLGDYGISTLVIEQRTAPSTLPRANTVSTATMELLRRWGLEEAARERSLDVEFRAWAVPTLTAVDGQAIDVGFPSREQAALISPTGPAAIGQDDLEPLLEAHARSHAEVRLLRGAELLTLDAGSGDGHLLTLRGPGERTHRVHARYLIGADGMHSAVRRELGIATTGAADLGTRLAVHFRAPLWELLGDRRHVIYFLTTEPDGRAFVPVGRPDRWVFAAEWSETARVENLSPRRMASWIAEAAGAPRLDIAVERAMPVTFGTALAERFAVGDAFLIGDAAHRVTPRGATGLNTAVRDGFDLGWKLAWVLRGWADEGLLGSYERERRPVAEFNTRRSTLHDGSVLGTNLGLNADIGGRLQHVWVARGERLVSTLDLLGPGLTLFAGPGWTGPIAAEAPPVTVERLDAIAARGLGLTAAGSLLARPDGQLLGMSNPLGGVAYAATTLPARTSRRVTANPAGSPW